MDDDSTHIHQLNTTVRTLCSHVTNDPLMETSRFYVGTCSSHEQNKIYTIDFDDYENSISVENYKTVITTPIWQICHFENFLTTISDNKCQIYDSREISPDAVSSSNLDKASGAAPHNNKVPGLTLKHQFEDFKNPPLYVSFGSTSDNDTSIGILGPKAVSFYDLSNFSETCQVTLPEKIKPNLERGEIKYNLHDPFQVFQCGGRNLNLIDTRSGAVELNIRSNYRIRSFDVNPNRPDWVSTGGDDRTLSIFDVRNYKNVSTYSYLNSCSGVSNANGNSLPGVAQRPEKFFHQLDTVHSHWIWKVRYNPFHDRLLLSGGSDNRYCLYNHFESCSDNIKRTNWMSSTSSQEQVTANETAAVESDLLGKGEFQKKFDQENSTRTDDKDQDGDGPDDQDDEFSLSTSNIREGIVACYEDFDDSVYDLAWSNSDPWIYMGCSYDGRLVLSHVPKDVKYSILL